MNPARIGRYEILRPLGKGAMGLVYLARDPQIERTLALKTVRFDGPSQSFSVAEAKARFLKEAKISGRLQHPNIVTVFDVGEDEGTLFLAMEYISGGSLAQRLAEPEAFPVVERIRVLAEVADALSHAHQRGVLHRDVKPANILLTDASVAKVTDFGIGKLLTGDTDLTTTGQMVGSPAYMSPEQIRGDKLDVRSDIFSLGVVLYQTLTLNKPFPADTLTTLVYQILHDEPADPLVHNDELPPEISEIVRKCLAKNREERYGDAAEIADELRGLIGITPLVSTSALSESKMARARAAALAGTAPAPAAPATPASGPAAAPSAARPAGPSPTDVSASRRMTRTGGRTSTTSSQPTPVALAGAGVAALVLVGVLVGGFFFLRAQGLFGPPGTPGAVPVPRATPTPTPTPGAGSVVTPTPGEAPAATPTAGPSPTVAAALPTVAAVPTPTRTPKTRQATAPPPSPTPRPTATPTPAPTKTPTPPPAIPPDATYITRRYVKISVSPSQARVYLNGRYIGISDDWDDAGGGALLAFPTEGRYRLRFAYPDRKDGIVDVLVAPNAVEDKVEIERSLDKGTPGGPTGPEGKLGRPDYQTTGLVRVSAEPPWATVTIDGKEMGPASRFAEQDMQFREQGVFDLVLTAPGYQQRTVRILVSPATGKDRAIVREKLKKS